MKYALIIPDGAADTPIPDLGDTPPREAATKPTINGVALAGKLATLRTATPHNIPAPAVRIRMLNGNG